jgi:hypothetical protein
MTRIGTKVTKKFLAASQSRNDNKFQKGAEVSFGHYPEKCVNDF